jgi:hypothetical protein
MERKHGNTNDIDQPPSQKVSPIDLLSRAGVEAKHFNRHKLGQSLDQVFDCGCDLLVSEVALHARQQE